MFCNFFVITVAGISDQLLKFHIHWTFTLIT